MKDELLVDFSTDEPDALGPEHEAEPLPNGARRYPPKMYKKFLAYRGSTIIMGVQLTLILALLFAYLCIYQLSNPTVIVGLMLMYFGTLITFGWCAIGYVNGQAALDGYGGIVKLGINKAAEVKMGGKGKPEPGEPDKEPDGEADLRG